MPKKLKIAITGGIGAGKTEFCNLLREAGYPVINADKTAKDVLINNSAVKNKIIAAFGVDSYSDGGLNTKYLARTVFNDENKIKLINSIVHPEVIKEIELMMKNLLNENDLVFVEAALIYEADMDEMFDYVTVITAREEVKIARIIQRDNVTAEEIAMRMENQIPDETKKGWADFVFDNNAGLAELKGKVDFFLTILTSIVQK